MLICIGAPAADAENYATNTAPLAFGPDQTIIDLNKIVEWGPLWSARRGAAPKTAHALSSEAGAESPAELSACGPLEFLERETGFEPATLSLGKSKRGKQ